MQSVADRVGVRAPSLYKRVRDRDALLAYVSRATVEELGERLDASDGTLPALGDAYRSFAKEHPEGFRLMFSAYSPVEALRRTSAPIIRAAGELVGEADALDAARLVTAWATGFINMELAGDFRLGGDVDRAWVYGLDRLIAGLTLDDPSAPHPPRVG
jgi:AcrR family transcriptional regulator